MSELLFPEIPKWCGGLDEAHRCCQFENRVEATDMKEGEVYDVCFRGERVVERVVVTCVEVGEGIWVYFEGKGGYNYQKFKAVKVGSFKKYCHGF